MENLITVTGLVMDILENDSDARNSDNYLYLKVCEKIGKSKGIDLSVLSVPKFFLRSKEYGFPCFESVRRTRQKIQASFPELAGSKTVEKTRNINEKIYREYARGHLRE